MSIGKRFAHSQASALRFDFTKPLDGWTTVSGKWAIEDVPALPKPGEPWSSGRRTTSST